MSAVQNLNAPVEYLTAAYSGRTWPRSRLRASAPQRADLLTSYVSLCLDDPAAFKHLHETVGGLREVNALSELLLLVAKGARSIMDAEFGDIQLIDPRNDSLLLVTQFGFGPEFLSHFAVVHDDHSVCGQAALAGAQVVVPDARDDPDFAPNLAVFRGAGVRAVQSTPLIDRAGQVIGMISTHASKSGQLAEPDLRTMELYGQLAGEVISRRLRAMLPVDWSGRRSRARAGAGLIPAEPPLDQVMSRTLDRLVDANLMFEDAQNIVTDYRSATRLQLGIDQIHEAIRAIQLAVLDLEIHYQRT